MIDDEILDMLVHRDPAVRKDGVKRLAQSKSRDVLPYLAEVVRDDEDDEVRDLARKAGQYIQKNAPATVQRSSPPPQASSSRSNSSSSATLYDDDDEDDDDLYADYLDDEDVPKATPLPSEFRVSEASAERAKGMVQSALDYNMRHDNEKAVKALAKAVRLDPRLMHDTYTIGLAGDIMKMDGKAALQSLAPSQSELEKMKRDAKSSSAKTGSAHRMMGFGVMMGAVIVLVAFFLFPWVNLSPIETIDENSQPTTLGEVFNRLDSELDDEAIDGLRLILGDEADSFIDAIQGLTIEFNGWDTTQMATGQLDYLDAIGIRPFLEAMVDFAGGVGVDTDDVDMEEFQNTRFVHEPTPLDYSLLLVPVSAGLAAVLGIMLISNGRISIWVFTFLLGALGIGPMLYFYLSGINDLFGTESFAQSLTGLGEATDTNTIGEIVGTELIGLGFWVAVVGMAIVLILPFIALLTMPNAE